jgi:galactokinase
MFNDAPRVHATAPGRVNLLGEHTDYNDGFVLPTAIPQQTMVSLGFSPDAHHHFYSEELEAQVSFTTADSTPEGFASYLFGCLRVLEQEGHTIPPLNGYVSSTVPIGAGLSSSAALEVAMLRSLRSLLHLNLDDIAIAKLAQQAEIQFAGVQCGIMDQMASSLADAEHLLFLDTRTLDRQLVPLPAGTEILVMDSGIPRTLAGSGYNQRRAECEEAARQLGVAALRDVTDVAAIAALPELLQRRARHVITENNRVLEAKQGISAARFGELMNASHASLRDDYEVSIAGLDQLVATLQQTSSVFGARLTGAGFGGACVALVSAGKTSIAQTVLNRYHELGYTGQVLVPQIPQKSELIIDTKKNSR